MTTTLVYCHGKLRAAFDGRCMWCGKRLRLVEETEPQPRKKAG